MKAIAELLLTFLLNACWQIAVVTAFALMCAWLLRGVGARYRHALWVAALVLSFCLPVLSCSHLINQFFASQPAEQQTRVEPVASVSISSREFEPLREGESAPPPLATSWKQSIPSIRLSRNLASILVALYLLFLCYRGTNLFRAWRKTRSILRGAFDVTFIADVQRIIDKCKADVQVKRIKILVSREIPLPITVGALDPVVILSERLLHEADEAVLMSALGHELAHVARRDYLLNLIYEFIHLPISFHPCAAFLQRRIKQTRELSCDELVTRALLRPEAYARSLVRLASSAPLTKQLDANTTIGITDSNNLEVRIMSLLKKQNLTARRKSLLLCAASLLLVMPCIAAAAFGFSFDITRQEPAVTQDKDERSRPERLLKELQAKEKQLTERARREGKGEESKSLREVEQKLLELQKENKPNEQSLKDAAAKLKQVEAVLTEYQKSLPENEARMKELKEELAKVETKYPGDEAKMRELREKLLAADKMYSEGLTQDGYKKPRLISHVEAEYSEDARAKKIEGIVGLSITVDTNGIPQDISVTRSLYPSLDQKAIEAVQKWRFEPATQNGQPVARHFSIEIVFNVDYSDKVRRGEAHVFSEAELKQQTDQPAVFEARKRKDLVDQGREERSRRQTELTKLAGISMDRAIQIALSQFPGKVLACSLGRDGDKVFYHLVVINSEGEKSTTTYVWLGATDGQIIKSEKER